MFCYRSLSWTYYLIFYPARFTKRVALSHTSIDNCKCTTPLHRASFTVHSNKYRHFTVIRRRRGRLHCGSCLRSANRELPPPTDGAVSSSGTHKYCINGGVTSTITQQSQAPEISPPGTVNFTPAAEPPSRSTAP